jgi:hypothetical protein
MAISVFPTPITSSSSINANSVTAASPNVLYEGILRLEPAIYQVSCASGTIANVHFMSSTNTIITTSTTSSGTVTLNLGTTADRVRVWTNTGSNIVVTITKIANSLVNGLSGTLDTITTTSTYTGTSTSGFGYAVLGGGGGGGGGGNASTGAGGWAGGGGGVAHGIIALTGSMAVTIGTGGTAGPAWANNSANGGNGGISTFAGMTANGGSGGGGGTTTGGGGGGGTATGGLINNTGGSGSGGTGNNAGVGNSSWPFVVASLGTSGNSPGSNVNPGTTGTGFSAGGGAGGGVGGSGPAGGAGRPGVLYVLRF